MDTRVECGAAPDCVSESAPGFATVSCATLPKTYSGQNSPTAGSEFNVAGTRLMQWFNSSQVQIKTVDRASGVSYAERASVADAEYADCGRPGIATAIARPISMNVFVQPVHAKQTRVTINVAVSETRKLDPSLVQVSCSFTGRLESQIPAAATTGR